MKRIFAAVLALCLCAAGAAMAQESEDGWAAGDTVVFGSYEQDNVLTNGKEPLEWIVLKTEGDRAMLITRYLIVRFVIHTARKTEAASRPAENMTAVSRLSPIPSVCVPRTKIRYSLSPSVSIA